MDKYKKIFKNLGILTIGQFSSKILVFLMVPLYTSVLSTEEYGAYDFILTTINLLIPILTLNICVSSQRFMLDQDKDESTVVKTSFKYAIIGILLTLLIVLINWIFQINRIIADNSVAFFLLFTFMALNMVLVEIAVGSEQIKHVAISGVISTFTTIILCICFLLVVKQGIIGYFIANILGISSQTIYLFAKLKIFKLLTTKNPYSKDVERNMLKFSRPQIANNISWWVNNAADRYIITWFCGVGVNGIYSVAYKIPAIVNMLGGIFNQATGISIIKNFDAQDKDNFFSNIYKVYNVFLVFACSILIILTKVIARLMYAKDFYVAWKYAPFLLIASILGGMAGYMGSAFSATYAAKEYAQSTALGAAVNVVLNFILVPLWGPIWAAVATLISYFVIWLLRCYHMNKIIKTDIRFVRDVVSYALLTLQGVVINITAVATAYQYIINIALMIVLAILYKDDLIMMLRRLKDLKNKTIN